MSFGGVARSGFVWWACLFALYLLFASKLTWAEGAVGVLSACLGAIGAVVTARTANAQFRFRLNWLGRLARLPVRVLADCGVVGSALWRRVTGKAVRGTFRTVPFDAGGDDAASAARRALVTAGVSLAPNTYVVAVDRERGLLLVHQLVPSPRPPGNGDREWPL